MKLSTDKEILKAAQECSDAYHKEAYEENIETKADWKEIAFFIQGADWIKRRLTAKVCSYLEERLGGRYATTSDKDHINSIRKIMEEPL